MVRWTRSRKRCPGGGRRVPNKYFTSSEHFVELLRAQKVGRKKWANKKWARKSSFLFRFLLLVFRSLLHASFLASRFLRLAPQQRLASCLAHHPLRALHVLLRAPLHSRIQTKGRRASRTCLRRRQHLCARQHLCPIGTTAHEMFLLGEYSNRVKEGTGACACRALEGIVAHATRVVMHCVLVMRRDTFHMRRAGVCIRTQRARIGKSSKWARVRGAGRRTSCRAAKTARALPGAATRASTAARSPQSTSL